MRFLMASVWGMSLFAAGCGADGGGRTSITVKGSDTMVILGQRWAEQYMSKRSGVVIQVTGGGSGTGIAALINGATDICEASRPMKTKERDQLKAKYGREVCEIPVAMDGLAVFVHESNPLREISLEQLRAIYTGTLRLWETGLSATGQSGGPPIVAYGRENNSGTYMYFKEHVLGEQDFASDVQTLPGTAAVINAVSRDRNGIGYGGIGYLKGVRTLFVKKDAGSPAIEPTLENVVKGSYPISRHLYFYTVGTPQGETRSFVEWVLSGEGQEICEKVGYYPLPEERRSLPPATVESPSTP